MKAAYDTIIIGSGIGGLACAAALTKLGHKVLVLEQHNIAGGLTQTFSRKGFTWDVGVHKTTPKRFLSSSLGIKTPINRLYLAGQDVVTPGITGAMMGGLLAAAAIDRRIFRHIR